MICQGVFEQLARYTMRYQESDLHLGLSSSLTSTNSLYLFSLLTLSLNPSSSNSPLQLVKQPRKQPPFL